MQPASVGSLPTCRLALLANPNSRSEARNGRTAEDPSQPLRFLSHGGNERLAQAPREGWRLTPSPVRRQLEFSFPTNEEHVTRLAFATIMIAVAMGPVGLSCAAAMPSKETGRATVSAPAKNMILAQRCRCVERRWNGSCKLRVCRERW